MGETEREHVPCLSMDAYILAIAVLFVNKATWYGFCLNSYLATLVGTAGHHLELLEVVVVTAESIAAVASCKCKQNVSKNM